MAGFVTNTPQMQAGARHVTDVTARIKQLLDSLGAEVDATPAHFQGQAATTFRALMEQYKADNAKLNKALSGIAEQLGSASDTYRSSDQLQGAALQKAASGLNMS